jgi:phosphatidate cytidylyltransferase
VLRWRTVTAVVLAPVVLGAIAVGKWAVLGLVIAVVALAAHELSQALQPLPFAAAFGTGAIPVLLAVPYGTQGILAGILLSLPWALFWLAGKPEYRTLRAVLAGLLMALWVGAPLAHLVLISRMPEGFKLVLLAVVGTWVSDSGAYFAGRFLGRHLLFATLSPNKTVEGGLGGLILSTVVIGYASYALLGIDPLAATAMGAAISILSQSGDLFESVLKRILDLKDLGSALPGHGGMLDRIDSLLFTAPAVYYISLII